MADVVDLPRPFGPYLLLVQLARGGMGEVFLAKHGGLQGFEKYCVVKTLRPELAQEDEYVARFTEEARVVVQLSHRNVCPVFDVGRAQGQLYVAMEHLIGRDLRMLIAKGPLTIAVAVHVVGEVLEALDYAHRFIDAETEQPLGLVHRDVSPHNIILGVEGDVKLIDFGIATTSKSGPVAEGSTVLGKLGYMAPEHARGDVVDGRADQYAAAVLLVELLTGAGFFDNLSREQAWRIAGKGGHRPEGFAQLDPAVRAILDRALEPNRDRRFPTCAAFGDAVVTWARSLGHVADARDVRRLVTKTFPDLPSQVRSIAREHADQHAPAHDVVSRTPGFETIATTMMIAPTTAGFDAVAPATSLIRDRAPAAAPIAPRRAFSLVAMGGAVVLAFAAGAVVALQPSNDERVIALPSHDPLAPLASTPSSGPSSGPSSSSASSANAPNASASPSGTSSSTSSTSSATTPSASASPSESPSASHAPNASASHAPNASASSPRSSVPSVKSAARSVAKPSAKPSAKLSTDAKRDLAYLAGCTEKVSCAGPVIEWARKKLSDADATQVADSAKDCAKKCRLK